MSHQKILCAKTSLLRNILLIPVGFEGNPGETGERGMMGNEGAPGNPGGRGLPGPPGLVGNTGRDGEGGQQGFPGDTGPPASASGFYVTRHSQDQVIPSCPLGSKKLWVGYSFLYVQGMVLILRVYILFKKG